jgi:hypothetical protein
MRKKFAHPVAIDVLRRLLVGLVVAGQVHSAYAASSIEIIDNGYPELCAAAKKQAEQLLQRDQNVCAFPKDDSKDGIRPIDWTPATDERAQTAWSDFLAKANWDKTIPNSDYDQFWKRNGPGIVKTLKTGVSLDQARIDVDNDGSAELVYRATTIRPVDPKDTLKGWAPLPCQGQLPFYSIFFARSEWTRMGVVAMGGSAVSADLLQYRGRTYLIDSGPDSFSVSEISRTSTAPTEAYANQVCAFLAH